MSYILRPFNAIVQHHVVLTKKHSEPNYSVVPKIIQDPIVSILSVIYI